MTIALLLYPRHFKISVILCFWLRRRLRRRTPMLVHTITLSQIHLSNSYLPERYNINSMYEDLGWVSLSRRRLIHRLTLFYKITNNMTPQYLADIVPPSVGDRQIYNLRSRDNITQIHAQKQRYTIILSCNHTCT